MLIMKNPCHRACPERSATCHAICKRYKDFEAENAQDREEKHKQKQEYMRASDTQIAGMKRMQRGRRK